MLQSICGPRTSLLVRRCGAGLGMILLAGTTFGVATRKKYIGIASGSANYGPSLKEDGLHSSLQRMMRLTTTPSF